MSEVAVAVIATLLAFQTAAYTVLTVSTLNFSGGELRIVVLGWMWILMLILSGSALLVFIADRLQRRGVTVVVVTISLAGAMVTLLYFIFFDIFRSPVRQYVLDSFMGLIVLGQILAVYLLRRHVRSSVRLPQVAAFAAAVPIFALFGGWFTYVYSPQHSAPLINVSTTIEVDDAQTAAHSATRTISGSVTLTNAGSVQAAVTGSYYKITARRTGSAASDLPMDVSRQEDFAQAINGAQALEPLGTGSHRFDSPYLPADDEPSLLQLDDVTSAQTFLLPGEVIQRSFVATVNAPRFGETYRISLETQVFLLNGQLLTPPNPCSGSIQLNSNVQLVQNVNPEGGWFSCYRTSLPTRTPVGWMFGDESVVDTYFVIANTSVPGSETGGMFQLSSLAGLPPDSPTLASDAAQKLFDYAPSVWTGASAETALTG